MVFTKKSGFLWLFMVFYGFYGFYGFYDRQQQRQQRRRQQQQHTAASVCGSRHSVAALFCGGEQSCRFAARADGRKDRQQFMVFMAFYGFLWRSHKNMVFYGIPTKLMISEFRESQKNELQEKNSVCCRRCKIIIKYVHK